MVCSFSVDGVASSHLHVEHHADDADDEEGEDDGG